MIRWMWLLTLNVHSNRIYFWTFDRQYIRAGVASRLPVGVTVVCAWVFSHAGSTCSTNEVYNSFKHAMLVSMRWSWGPLRPAFRLPICQPRGPLTPVIADRTKS